VEAAVGLPSGTSRGTTGPNKPRFNVKRKKRASSQGATKNKESQRLTRTPRHHGRTEVGAKERSQPGAKGRGNEAKRTTTNLKRERRKHRPKSLLGARKRSRKEDGPSHNLTSSSKRRRQRKNQNIAKRKETKTQTSSKKSSKRSGVLHWEGPL